MSTRHWTIEDVFGKRFRLWIATRNESGASPDVQARNVMCGLVYSSLRRQDPYDRTSAVLFAIYNELAVLSLSHATWMRSDLGSARRIADQAAEVLERAALSRYLRIERLEAVHPWFVLDEAPDTVRDSHASPPGPALPRADADDWVGIVVQDDDGRPLPNVRCRITSPGRSAVDLTTDAAGRVILRCVDSGACLIELPELDGREWDAASTAASL